MEKVKAIHPASGLQKIITHAEHIIALSTDGGARTATACWNERNRLGVSFQNPPDPFLTVCTAGTGCIVTTC